MCGVRGNGEHVVASAPQDWRVPIRRRRACVKKSTTRPPHSAIMRATARPIPRVDPVTIATLACERKRVTDWELAVHRQTCRRKDWQSGRL